MWLVFTVLDIIKVKFLLRVWALNEDWKHRDLRADVGGNNCKGLGIAGRQGIQRGESGDEAGGTGRHTGRHRPGQADQVPWLISENVGGLEFCKFCLIIIQFTAALESCMAKTFQQAFLVHSLCLWNHMSPSNDGNLPHHESITFLWKRRLTFSYLDIPYPSFYFFILYFKISVTFCIYKNWVFTVSLGPQHTDFGRIKSRL